MMDAKIGVVGAGAWGTALAQVLSEDLRELLLWAREPDVVEQVNGEHLNSFFLKDCRLRDNIIATQDMGDLAVCDILLLVTPAQHLRKTLESLPKTKAALVLCSKGIEADTQLLMSDLVKEARPEQFASRSVGANFCA